jgi:hypothetical protein
MAGRGFTFGSGNGIHGISERRHDTESGAHAHGRRTGVHAALSARVGGRRGAGGKPGQGLLAGQHVDGDAVIQKMLSRR